MTSRARRDLARDHASRLLLSQAGAEPRPSRADERALTEEARAREADERAAAFARTLEHLHVAEQELAAALRDLPRVDRRVWKVLDHARGAVLYAAERIEIERRGESGV
jgi:hypothetical protein